MFGGLFFMVDGKMCCGTHFDQSSETDLLMARIGQPAYRQFEQRKGCHSMDFTGRPMKGYAFITPDGLTDEKGLLFWLDLCVQYNPIASASKKSKKS